VLIVTLAPMQKTELDLEKDAPASALEVRCRLPLVSRACPSRW
jgi:hypothetical protein